MSMTPSRGARLRSLRVLISLQVISDTSNTSSHVSKARQSDSLSRRPRLRAAILAWEKKWSVPGLADFVSLGFSPRLRATLGRCAPAKGVITLHAKLLKGSHARLREVLCHEAAHVAVYLQHGRRVRAHGAEWSELVVLAGYEPSPSR